MPLNLFNDFVVDACDADDDNIGTMIAVVAVTCEEAGSFTLTFTSPEDEDATQSIDISCTLPPPAGDSDSDSDGISDAIDSAPQAASNSFDDGTTSGTITSRGDQTLTIRDEPSPLGVRMVAGGSGGAAPATVVDCIGTTYTLTAGDEVIITCGSSVVQVVRGTVQITVTVDGRIVGTATLDAGSALTFDDETLTFSNEGEEPVVVIINGMSVTLGAGSTCILTPGASADCMKDGWEIRTRIDGSVFKNQGDCIQYVNKSDKQKKK